MNVGKRDMEDLVAELLRRAPNLSVVHSPFLKKNSIAVSEDLYPVLMPFLDNLVADLTVNIPKEVAPK